jgi:mxaJ protein
MLLNFLSLVVLFSLPFAATAENILRVCADPNNLPFSNRQGQGFENKIAELIAAKMNARLAYVWWAQRGSFARRSLEEDACDLITGVPASLPDVLATNPYYRSTYVFVSRHDRALQVASLIDPRLSDLRIGVHIVGNDYAPPAYALARRGITKNIVGFSLLGEQGESSPARKLIDAVDLGEVDVGIAWGPFAGYFAQTAKSQLNIVPISPSTFLGVPFTYDISAGVRKGNEGLKAELDKILESESASIQQILVQYGVPQVH